MLREEDLSLTNGLEWTRFHPERFFKSGVANGFEVSTHVLCDVVFSGGRCLVERFDEWWLVASNKDWMSHDQYSPLELFERVVAAPYLGVNSMRAEVIVRAFASEVMIFSRQDGWRSAMAGADAGDNLPTFTERGAVDVVRALAFRVP
jgi:hypothetical protein